MRERYDDGWVTKGERERLGRVEKGQNNEWQGALN